MPASCDVAPSDCLPENGENELAFYHIGKLYKENQGAKKT
jgi:hypothetical protein